MVYDTAFFAELRKTHRIRQFAMEARKRSDLALGALLRDSLGWSLSKPKEERDAIAEKVQALIATGEKLLTWQDRISAKAKSKSKRPAGADDPAFKEWESVILASLLGRAPMAKVEAACEARMCEMVSGLPIVSWYRANAFKDSLRSLAVILAETGDLSNYATVSKVWKRMGVAVMDGVRQGGLSKTASKEQWIRHGYVRRRRSQLYVIGEAFIKQHGRYREVYLAEKERQRRIAADKGLKVVPAAKIPKARADEFMSDGHVANRARRYMEKRFLLDLWVEWRAAILGMDSLPPENSEMANVSLMTKDWVPSQERAATTDVKTIVDLPPEQTQTTNFEVHTKAFLSSAAADHPRREILSADVRRRQIPPAVDGVRE